MSKPLTPADCDLRDFQFVHVDVRRLLCSETWITGTADEKCAAMTLWLESWHQVPAASIPANDKMLAHLSGAGSKWAKVKEHALRGWKDGGDGRLYHAVVAEKALEAWIEKLSAAIAGNAGNAKRWGIPIDSSALQSSLIEAVLRLKDIAPRSKALNKKTAKIAEHGSQPVSPPDSGNDRNREGEGEREGYKPLTPLAGGEEVGKASGEAQAPADDDLENQLLDTWSKPDDSRIQYVMPVNWTCQTDEIEKYLVLMHVKALVNGKRVTASQITPEIMADFIRSNHAEGRRLRHDQWVNKLAGYLVARIQAGLNRESPDNVSTHRVAAKPAPSEKKIEYWTRDPKVMMTPSAIAALEAGRALLK